MVSLILETFSLNTINRIEKCSCDFFDLSSIGYEKIFQYCYGLILLHKEAKYKVKKLAKSNNVDINNHFIYRISTLSAILQ